MAASKKVDYGRIEPGWRAGVLSPRQLAAQYTEETGEPVSHAAIINHFKRAGVERDLGAKIQAKADAMVTQAMVTGKVTAQLAIPEKQVIEDNATQIAMVRIGHRKDIARARALTNSLMAELEHQAGSEAAALLADLGEMMRNPDEKGQDKLNEAYQKIISLPSRVKTMKDLGDTLKGLVAMEREAHNIPAVGSDLGDEAAKPRKRVVLEFVDAVPK